MRSATTERFRTLPAAPPESVQRQAATAYRLFRTDPSHPGLRFKPLDQGDPAIHSMRIGRLYRAIGIREGDRMIWMWIGSHAAYDRLVERA